MQSFPRACSSCQTMFWMRWNRCRFEISTGSRSRSSSESLHLLRTASPPPTKKALDKRASRSGSRCFLSSPAHSPPEAMATSSPWLHTIATPSPPWGAEENANTQFTFLNSSSKWGNGSPELFCSYRQQLEQWCDGGKTSSAAEFSPGEVTTSRTVATSGSWTIMVEMKTTGD